MFLRVQYWNRYCILYTLLLWVTTPSQYHQMNFHLYADDMQLYISFKTSCINDMELNEARMEACVREIDLWMVQNRLKLNQGKTEVLVFSSRYHPRPNIHDLTIVDEVVKVPMT